MNPSEAGLVAEQVARETGVPLSASVPRPGLLRLSPSGYDHREAFTIQVHTGWRRVGAEFSPGRFARPLLERMGSSSDESRLAARAIAGETSRHSRLALGINGTRLDPTAPEWPFTPWTAFELSVVRTGVVPEELSPHERTRLLAGLAIPVLAIVVVLVGIEDFEADEAALEGAVTETLSRRYERRAINRRICLALKGHRCWCCGFEFGPVYGPAADGFVEVHHRIPASGMGSGYRVHPERDLFPVCSNCHSVIHLTDPPEDPDQLRRRLEQAPPSS